MAAAVYYIVIGSFKSEENALRFMREKQQQYTNIVNLGMGQSSRLYQIGVGPYSEQEAQQAIKGGIKGWILKK